MKKTEQVTGQGQERLPENGDPEILYRRLKDERHPLSTEKERDHRGKGAINNRMTNYFMRQLEKTGVPTHLSRNCPTGKLPSESHDHPAGVIFGNIARFRFQTVRVAKALR
jgi:phosphoribosylaminoimidazole-succinocarboxamide synthase